MPVLHKDSAFFMDGAVKLYRCERRRKWQAGFTVAGKPEAGRGSVVGLNCVYQPRM